MLDEEFLARVIVIIPPIDKTTAKIFNIVNFSFKKILEIIKTKAGAVLKIVIKIELELFFKAETANKLALIHKIKKKNCSKS